MSGYELRAEHQPANPVGRETVRWHIVRRRHLVALCGRLIDPVSEDRPIRVVAEIAPACRCVDCWDWWQVVQEAHRESAEPAARSARPVAPSVGWTRPAAHRPSEPAPAATVGDLSKAGEERSEPVRSGPVPGWDAEPCAADPWNG
jgi:hypothetical protein